MDTKFGDCRYYSCADMIASIEIENKSFDHDHAHFKDSLSSLG